MKKFLFNGLLVAFIFVGCNKEENNVENTPNTQATTITDGVVNGRYHFSSVESLTDMMNELGKDNHLLDKKMEELYKEGFRPKYPIGDIDNEPALASIYAHHRPAAEVEDETVSDIEDDDLVADPILASFIDENNELVVKDTLYKFTKFGVFSSHLSDTLKLRNYLEANNQKELSEQEVFRLRETDFGKRQVANGVFRFIAPISELEKNEMKAHKSQAAARTPIEQLQPIINELRETDGEKNWFLHTITGKSRVAVEHFDRRHRVKVEFFNQNYGFYKSMGISVRNQTRRLRVWWASKADEIALGVNYIYLKYNVTSDVRTFVQTHNSGNPLVFFYNNQYHYDYNYYRDAAENVSVPFAEFGGKKLLNIHIPNTNNYSEAPYHLFNYDILNNENLSYLKREGFNFLRRAGAGDNEFIVTRFLPNYEMELVYFAEPIQKENDNDIKTHLYTDTNFLITFGSGMKYPAPSIPTSPRKTLKDYSDIKVDIYGMARVGGQWKGVRMFVR